MKCNSCQNPLDEGTKFCPECGKKVVITPLIVLCPGKLENGSACGAELQESFKFCKYCGTRVDLSLFPKKIEFCVKCGNAFTKDGEKFCAQCGTLHQGKSETISHISSEDASSSNSSITASAAPENSLVISIRAKFDAETGPNNIDQDSASKFQVSSAPGDIEDKKEEIVEPMHPLSQSSSISENVQKNSLDGDSKDMKGNFSSDHESALRDTADLEGKMNDVTQPDISGNDSDAITADSTDDNRGDNEGDEKFSDDSTSDTACKELAEVTETGSTESVPMHDKERAKVKLKKKPKLPVDKIKKMMGRADAAVGTNVNNLKQVTKKFKKFWKRKMKSGRKQGKKKTLDITNPCSLESSNAMQESPQKIIVEIDKNVTSNSQPDDNFKKVPNDQIHAVDGGISTVVGDKTEKTHENQGNEMVSIQETGHEINSDMDKGENTENGQVAAVERTKNQGREVGPIQEIGNEINSDMEKSKRTENGQVVAGERTGASAAENQHYTSIKDQVKEGMEPKRGGDGKSEKEMGRGPTQNSNTPQKIKGDAACGKRPAKNSVPRKNEDVRVHFHALLSPEFELSHGDQIQVRFGKEELGGWQSDDFVPESIRRTDYQFIELKMELDIPRNLFSKDPKIEYSYVVVKDWNCADENHKFMWEHYCSNGHGKRTLYLPDKGKNTDEWHQYDGVVKPKPEESLIDKFRNFLFTDIKESDIKDLVRSVEYFLPKFFQDLYSGQLPEESVDETFIQLEETFIQLEELLSSMKRIYVTDKACFRADSDYNRKISDIFLAKVLKSFEGVPLCDWKESPKESEIRMLQATTIVCVVQRFNLELSPEEKELLTRGLLVRPNNVTQKCHDVDCIDKYFLRGKKQQLSDFLISFIDRMVTVEPNPFIIFCVPLHHFLTGTLQPFDKVTEDVSHGKKNTDWWGTKHLSNAVQTFKKGPASKWPMRFEEFVSVLYPLFEMDYFLPRTFMAMLSLTEVEEVIKTGKIPLEVCAATLSYYVLVTRPREHISYVTNEEKMVGAAIYALGDMFKSVQAQEERTGYVDQIFSTPSQLDEMDNVMPTAMGVFRHNQTLGILGLCMMIQDLCPPDDNYLNDAGKQQEWLQKICNFRPVIKKGLTLYSSATESNVFTEAKQQWTMITVMKLFIEHVVILDKEADKYGLKNVMPLWMLLKQSSDFKKVKALETLEKFLKLRNNAAIKYFLGLMQTCSVCNNNIEGVPVMLPCKDTICIRCFGNATSEDSGTRKCPKCTKNIPDTFNPDALRERKSVQKFKEYQSRCNSFFMDVVSQLCFADNTPPSDEVVNRLLGYITMTAAPGRQVKMETRHLTKELTIFNDCVDPNPVFRSFLLQLLLRTREKEVHTNLEKYFSKAKVVIGPDNDRETHMVQLSQLVVQCLEDSFYMDCTEDNEINIGATYLTDAEQIIKSGPNMVERLYGIAKARVGLAITAKHIHETVLKQGQVASPQQQELIGKAATLCEGDCKWPKIFFIKYLCRYYGVDSYEAICSKTDVEYLRWIKYQETTEKVREVLDRYIVCGPHYIDIRETVTKVVLGEDVDQLNKAIQDMKIPENRKEILLCLALHREITMSRLRDADKNKVTPEAIEILKKYCSEARFLEKKETAQKILENDYEVHSPFLTVTPDLDLKCQGVLCLLMHCDLVFRSLHGDRTLVQPLVRLVTQPQTMMDAFLPTMPQDDVEEIRRAFLPGINDSPVFYRCPNGHPYVIGECGRPVTEGKCQICRAAIGGRNYQLNEGNSPDLGGVDRTKTGHILGCAENRTQIGPERSLTPACCGIIRLLTHLTMMLGANIDSLAVSQFIQPTITDDMVSPFLWKHVEQDLDDLHKTLGKSLDDVLMLMHCILSVMMETHDENEMNVDEMCGLTTTKARNDWEKRFSEKYIAPTLQNMENVLKEFNQQLAEDKRLGSDPLPCIVYEKAIPQENITFEMPQEIASMWRYRSRITMDHLHHEFEVQMTKFEGQLKVLQLFLKEEHHLRAIRYIPSILRLHRILIQKYQWKLDRAEASTKTVNMLKKEFDGDELKRLLDEYAEVWELVKENLVHVPKKYHRCHIDDATPVSHLLPTASEAGQCAYSVLEFLFRKQNDFLDNYCREVKRSIKDIPHVKVRDITPAHLISYHPEQDILPLVLANCNYSFEVGKGTTIEYNFTNLERQIIDRFLFGKSWIDIEITLMVYRAQYTNVTVFRKLQEKIPQEPLSNGVKHQISEEFRSLPDLCQALDNLDIAISFLKSIGGNPENNLDKFMVETLKMEQSLFSPKAQQICQYRHAKSLWLLLSLEKTKMIAFHNQTIFDGVPEQFHKQLSVVLHEQMMNFLQPMSIERHDLLVELMFECIILVISVPQNPDAEDYVSAEDNKFKDYLQALKMDKDLDIRLDTFPDGVLSKFCVATWALTYQRLLAKTKQK